MYRCEKHGELKGEWCGECEDFKNCDCSETIQMRFKDLTFDCEDGEKTITIYVKHCETCGDVKDIW